MGTWQMPLKIPPPRVTLTSRTAAGAASLTKWIQKNPDLLKASNGFRPEILGKVPLIPASQFQPVLCPGYSSRGPSNHLTCPESLSTFRARKG